MLLQNASPSNKLIWFRPQMVQQCRSIRYAKLWCKSEAHPSDLQIKSWRLVSWVYILQTLLQTIVTRKTTENSCLYNKRFECSSRTGILKHLSPTLEYSVWTNALKSYIPSRFKFSTGFFIKCDYGVNFAWGPQKWGSIASSCLQVNRTLLIFSASNKEFCWQIPFSHSFVIYIDYT